MNITERIRLNHQTSQLVTTLAALTALVLSHFAVAGEGVLEINQTCAENGGCFAGDDAGFPVQITESGSYVLTGNLHPPADLDGIRIEVNDVSIDLGGFSIRGDVECTGTPVTSCSTTGFSLGINGAIANGATVTDGVVSGHSGFGVSLGAGAYVAGIKASENAVDGVTVDEDSIVKDVVANRNGETGIDVGLGSKVTNSIGYGNSINGISGATNSIIAGSIGNENGNNGIGAGEDSKIVDSTANQNSGNGVFVSSSSMIRGVTASENEQAGALLFNSRSNVDNSIFIDNTGLGVECEFGDNSAIRNSVLDLNNAGGDQFSGTCIALGSTICSGDQSCP